jgi:hypothetical protein
VETTAGWPSRSAAIVPNWPVLSRSHLRSFEQLKPRNNDQRTGAEMTSITYMAAREHLNDLLREAEARRRDPIPPPPARKLTFRRLIARRPARAAAVGA